MCATCDFALPGGIHLCPACATKPQATLGAKRKVVLVWSLVLAVWCTIGLALVFLGAFAGNKNNEEALGVLLVLIVLIPAMVGMSLGMGAIDRRLTNPHILWVATIWNGVIIVIFILLCIIGLFM